MSETEFDEQIQDIMDYSGGNFLMVRMDCCRTLKGDCNAAMVLAYVLNMLRMKTKNERDKRNLLSRRMWFKCPAKDIQEDLGLTKPKQIRIVRKLVKNKFLKTRVRGWPQTLWIKVLTKKLKAIGNKTIPNKSGNKTLQLRSNKTLPPKDTKRTDYIANNLPKNPSNNVRLTANGTSGASQYGFSSTKKMLAVLGEKKKILQKPNLPKSAAEFDLLFKEVKQRDGITFTEARNKVNRTMKKYLNGIDRHSHWPEAWSAAGFREKFIKIESAIKKAEKNGEAEPDAPKAKVIHEGNGHTRYILSLED